MTTGENHFVMGGTSLYSPSVPSGGESALFSVEVLAAIGTPSLAISIETKNTEDTTWGVAGSFAAITALGVATKDVSTIKEEGLSDSSGGCWNALKWRISAAWQPVQPFAGLPRAPATCSRRA